MLIDFFHALITSTHHRKINKLGQTTTVSGLLQYEPFHIDRQGGFYNLGKFATRVNTLLLLGGFYLAYRLYVQGLRVLPQAGVTVFEINLALIIWIGSYILPVIALGVTAGAWMYYSF